MFTQADLDLIDRKFDELKKASLRRCANQTEYETVIKAFEFANEAHKGVRRRSGEPYILHPIAVAMIVVNEIGLGYKSIAAALLHDVVEDTEYTVEDIQRLFGEKIASFVDGLTKIKHTIDATHSEGDEAAYATTIQAENFKRILLTLNDDVRVILIKMADRLHNVRTIQYMPEHKRAKILSETMYIFVPLAHRLGLYAIKSELENIWFRYSEPEDYKMIEDKLNAAIEENGCAIDQFMEPISKSLTEAGYKFTISKRTKSPYSIWNKMRTKGVSFDQIYDIYAVRIIFEPVEKESERYTCWQIYARITDIYKSNTARIRDWVNTPKPNGYEALHCTVMSSIGNWVEIQIRSVRMNEIAEKGVAAHWLYKKKDQSNDEHDMDKWFEVVREALESPDVNALEFLDKFHSGILLPEMYVFTPKGESKNLPKGSTALDFAYSIHTEIGNKAIAAKVNMKLVPLSYTLHNGDQVNIITAESQKPQREWLDFVKTQKAKSLIYESLKADAKANIRDGQKILEQKLSELGIQLQSRVINKLVTAYNVKNKEDLYSQIGTNLIDLKDLEKTLKSNSENKFVKYWKLSFSKIMGGSDDKKDTGEEEGQQSIDRKKDYLLSENPEDKSLTYRVAECCHPIPGDSVIGFIENNEVVVHKHNCPTATTLAAIQGDKIVRARWSKHTILSFLARIKIRGIDRIGLLNELSQRITLDYSINIRKIFVETHDGIFEGYIDLYVHSTSDLNNLINNIKKIKSIVNVQRDEISEQNK